MRHVLSFLTLALVAGGCTAETAEDLDLVDEEADSEAFVDADAKSDSLADTSPYFAFEPDYRRCAFPMCGGYWVRLVNFGATPCLEPDGSFTWSDRCYVSELDLSALGEGVSNLDDLDASPAAGAERLLRGRYLMQEYPGGRSEAKLVVEEVWQAATDAPVTGTFYALRDRGIRCITTPCFSIHEAKLNSRIDRELSEVRLDRVTEDAAIRDAFFEALYDGRALAAGVNRRVGSGRRGLALVASQIYLPARPVPASARLCGSRGLPECARDEVCIFAPEAMCGAADHPGTCVRRPDVCAEVAMPVCGCDGETYGNACEAHVAGVSVLHDGRCEPEPEPEPEACVRQGCSSQLCVDASLGPIFTTCEWRPEYACLREATCERQADGTCGFTPTPELDMCLASL